MAQPVAKVRSRRDGSAVPLDERIIREITPIFDTRALGYSSMLVAAKVDTENPHRAAKIINSHPGVVHMNGAEIYHWYNDQKKVHP